jgi:hypothetical protein
LAVALERDDVAQVAGGDRAFGAREPDAAG